MGCDGGTIPRRDELVRTKKKPEQKDKDAEREFRWQHCALTQERLQEPIAMCGHGRLYSKQNILEALLEKQQLPEELQHVRSIKDIKTLNLIANPAYTEKDKCEGLLDDRHAPYICKLIGLEMSGKFRFVALWSCGCAISERALKQVMTANGSGNVCPLCQIPFSVEDVIVLNGNQEDIELMSVKMQMRAAKRKSGKKDKKAMTEKAKDDKDDEEEEAQCSSSKSAKDKNIKRKDLTGINLQDPEMKRLKTDFSVAKDPNATDVYKSLFTTHETEKQQDRAHWVTYNPFYN